MAAPLSIVVYSDVICPWCYVGKRRLEAALGAPDMPEQVGFAWRPFQLNPDMPADGIERSVYRARKFGAERSAELDRNMTETGREVGIKFAFDRMQRTPNTRLAHRLIWEAGRQGRRCCQEHAHVEGLAEPSFPGPCRRTWIFTLACSPNL